MKIEEEWSYQQGLSRESRKGQGDLVVAMAAIDPIRAGEMALQIHDARGDLSGQFDAQVRIARFLMNPQIELDKLFPEY